MEVASRAERNSFKPNIQMKLAVPSANTNGSDGKTYKFNCDFANLKNLHESMQEAMKMHNSSKTKMARFSSV